MTIQEIETFWAEVPKDAIVQIATEDDDGNIQDYDNIVTVELTRRLSDDEINYLVRLFVCYQSKITPTPRR